MSSEQHFNDTSDLRGAAQDYKRKQHLIWLHYTEAPH